MPIEVVLAAGPRLMLNSIARCSVLIVLKHSFVVCSVIVRVILKDSYSCFAPSGTSVVLMCVHAFLSISSCVLVVWCSVLGHDCTAGGVLLSPVGSSCR